MAEVVWAIRSEMAQTVDGGVWQEECVYYFWMHVLRSNLAKK